MMTNSINPAGATHSPRLNGPQESLIQIAFKLKNVFYKVSL
jgi:hypothetical protein